MPIEFTASDISIIENMMLTKTHKYIAEMIDQPVKETGDLIESLCKERDLMSYQFKLDEYRREQKKSRPAAKPRAAKKVANKKEDLQLILKQHARKQEDVIRRSLEVERLRKRDLRAEHEKKQTRVVDYSELHAIRIDHKTIIYIKPGEDEQKAREQFLKTYKKYFKEEELPKEQRVKECRRCKTEKLLKEFGRLHSNKDGRTNNCIECMREIEDIRKAQKKFN